MGRAPIVAYSAGGAARRRPGPGIHLVGRAPIVAYSPGGATRAGGSLSAVSTSKARSSRGPSSTKARPGDPARPRGYLVGRAAIVAYSAGGAARRRPGPGVRPGRATSPLLDEGPPAGKARAPTPTVRSSTKRWRCSQHGHELPAPPRRPAARKARPGDPVRPGIHLVGRAAIFAFSAGGAARRRPARGDPLGGPSGDRQ
ncbi:MAG: hypothetical protein GY856_15105 [bacterium]|nr:hypothetical protein [bacterium]